MSFFCSVHKFWDFYIPDKLFLSTFGSNPVNFLHVFSLNIFYVILIQLTEVIRLISSLIEPFLALSLNLNVFYAYLIKTDSLVLKFSLRICLFMVGFSLHLL